MHTKALDSVQCNLRGRLCRVQDHASTVLADELAATQKNREKEKETERHETRDREKRRHKCMHNTNK